MDTNSLFNIVFSEFWMDGRNIDAVVLFGLFLNLVDYCLRLWHV